MQEKKIPTNKSLSSHSEKPLIIFKNGNSSELISYDNQTAEFKGTSVESYRLEHSPVEAGAIVSSYIIQANKGLNTSHQAPIENIPFIAKRILDSCFGITFETLSNIILNGTSKQMYGQLDASMIGQWINDYKENQREEIRENSSYFQEKRRANDIDNLAGNWPVDRIKQFKKALGL